jgi:hypothetical protein
MQLQKVADLEMINRFSKRSVCKLIFVCARITCYFTTKRFATYGCKPYEFAKAALAKYSSELGTEDY